MAAKDGMSVGKLVGTVMSMAPRGADKDGWFVEVQPVDAGQPLRLTVVDSACLLRLGVAPNAEPAPPIGQRFAFETRFGRDGITVRSVSDPEVRVDDSLRVRADEPGLIPALVRVEVRAATVTAGTVLRTLAEAGHARGTVTQHALDEYAVWQRIRHSELGPETEREATTRFLKACLAALESDVVRHKNADPAAKRAAVRAMMMGTDALGALSASRWEARDGLIDLSRSRALGALMKDFPGSERKLAAHVAWATYRTIEALGKSDEHEACLEGIKAGLIRAFHPSCRAPVSEIADALDYAWRGLVRLEEDRAENPIGLKEMEAARHGVETAMRWLGVDPPDLDAYRTLRRARPVEEYERRMTWFLRYTTSRGLAPQCAKQTGEDSLAVVFQNGFSAVMSRSGVIRLLDCNHKLVAFQHPGKEIVEFAGARPSAVDVETVLRDAPVHPAP